ncbi:hypothetical protein DPMN_022495 [Dreissena polymorpha]|uniref:Uncharacterized protein n=1 Tax=Dreissena polymorpha TaxID=45954 RepID=A0A9D4JCX4_DREPO|nr:hypothetical protein DPMN_133441 [Dreissena polymorpha]KAH3898272.1 hypothetical protein DPMN_022495 [Dreissena polymorpha]
MIHCQFLLSTATSLLSGRKSSPVSQGPLSPSLVLCRSTDTSSFRVTGLGWDEEMELVSTEIRIQ